VISCSSFASLSCVLCQQGFFLILEERRVPRLFQIKTWRFLCSCTEVLLLIRWAIYGKQEFMKSAYTIQILLCSQQHKRGIKTQQIS